MRAICLLRHGQLQAMRTAVRAGVVVMILLAMGGCLIKPHPMETGEIHARAIKDYLAISSVDEPVGRPIDLYEAMARAVKYNLDAKVKAIQVQLAHQQLNVAHYSLLPHIAANAGFAGRNNFDGGVGQPILTGRTAVDPFTYSAKQVMSSTHEIR